MRFICKRCGNCCLNLWDAYQCSVDQADIDMWQGKSRDDILEWVDAIDCGGRKEGLRYLDKPQDGRRRDQMPMVKESAEEE